MEPESLRTASLYINNQLLSRGLLRNGQTIDFARPDKCDGGIEVTMGKVISVINDLILRRDRDATQRENLSQTIRALRADALCQSTDLERAHARHADTQRKLGSAEATERSSKQQIRAAEQAARTSKEEMGKMRVLVSQTRRQCANEVRKRERLIESLKKHVAEARRPRGSGKAVGVVTVNVVAGLGGDPQKPGDDVVVADTDYDLRMETNGFLTDLAKDLSEENENIGALLRRTIQTLRNLSGCEKGSMREEGMMAEMEAGYKNLGTEMGFIIEHLRNLLTNPSFVPLEELEAREEEIIRLREGFEKMEYRWREAVQMMDGWRKRMAKSGQAVNLEELQMGLRLSPFKPKEGEAGKGFQLSTLLEEGESETQGDTDMFGDSGLPNPPEPEYGGEDSGASESSLSEEEIIEEQPRKLSLEPRQRMTTDIDSSPPPGPPPQISPLRTTTRGNCGLNPPQQDRLDITVGKDAKDRAPPASALSLKISPSSNAEFKNEISPLSSTALDEISLLKPSSSHQEPPQEISSLPSIPSPAPKVQPVGPSKLPRPRDDPPPQQSPLTMASIAAKLVATEREADAARVRAKIRAAKLNRKNTSNLQGARLAHPSQKSQPDIEDSEPAQGDADTEAVNGTRKRKASSRSHGGRASRRRSTLSPWELESLMLGGAGVVVAIDGENG